jgi:protein involved in polysaccharide export with SLBB domain
VIISIWGTSENTIRSTISPDGNISIPNLGPVYLSGMTVKEATTYLQRELSKIYAGLAEDSSHLKLTLGQIRTISVNIMGEVAVPGTYRLSSFASVFHALYSAGGLSPIGSLRAVQVIRDGKKVATVDVYDYLMKGKTSDDIRLMDDDVILVPAYESLVNISGQVRRPMYYEMKQGETIADVLSYSGGFTGDAYKKMLRVIRRDGFEKEIQTVDQMNYSTFKVNDEDSVIVDNILDRYKNRVIISGAVWRAGEYQMSEGVNTVKALINKAQGLRGDAFLERAQLQREREDLTLEMIPIDLKGIMEGNVPDIPLKRNDVVYIPSIHDLKENDSITIYGEVAKPGTYVYMDHTTIKDIIMRAGGMLDAASTARIDVARRIKKADSTESSGETSENYSFSFKDGYVVGGDSFYLEPYDAVYVRRSPQYQKQENVSVTGEVLFGGTYSMSKKTERVADLIKRAGGLTPYAYVEGARLIRQMTEDELLRRKDALRMTNALTDSIGKVDMSTTYTVGFDLREALNNPSSESNVVLHEGDMLFIPTYNNTVKITGAVMYPNTVTFKAGESFGYYLNMAGGYSEKAKKSKAYIVYSNGTVAKMKKHSSKVVRPGSEIIIPTKEEKPKMSTGEIISMGTSVASLAAIIATLVNTFK